MNKQQQVYRFDRGRYDYYGRTKPSWRRKFKLPLWGGLAAVLVIVAGLAAYKFLLPTPAAKATDNLQFDASVNTTEKHLIPKAIKEQSKTFRGTATAKIQTSLEAKNIASVLSAYVPVMNVDAARQSVTKAELATMQLYVPGTMDSKTRGAVATALGVQLDKLVSLTGSLDQIPDAKIAFIPVNELTYKLKLLALDGSYYLDNFTKGAVFREAVFSGDNVSGLDGLKLNELANKDTTLKVNMTGVTALTRVMMKKLSSVKDPTYFSKLIGPFLADADITHVSNEVSFHAGCPYSNTAFCSPPEMIDALKASGVDLVELTGNHNNDTGNTYNTESINQYHALGWHTFGGGLNTTEAAKPYIADMKGSKVAFLGYNAADGPQSGAIANASIAGANMYSYDKVKADIAAAKQSANFVIVDMQYWECYAYPDGFVEYPVCDQTIGEQRPTFRQIIDAGADMVIGTQAHQPQYYEQYNGKPIYYGLGNLYFEQTSWPGTERGIILTHYFQGGKLVQTKLTPTIYDQALQTHVMGDADAVNFLDRLKTARQNAGL